MFIHNIIDGVTKSSIKRQKSDLREKEHSKTFQPAGGLSLKDDKKKKSAGNKKIRRPIFAVGGLDADMHDWSGSKAADKANKKAKPQKEFTDFDPEKRLRKSGKVSNKAFKSKGKHKRR